MGKPPAGAAGTIRLHGREYKTVALRVQEFRAQHPIAEGWAITTRLEHISDEAVLFRAAITDPQGREVAVGYAEEKRAAKGINATSALENCETSAIGRALAAAGYAGTEYASADELTRALNRQQASERQGQRPANNRNHHPSWTRDHKAWLAELKARGLTYEQAANYSEGQGWARPAQWGSDERARFLADLDKGQHPALHKPEAETVFVPDQTDLQHAGEGAA